MAPICTVKKEVVFASPGRNVAAHAHRHYVGRGVSMVEFRSETSTSDWGNTVRRRHSPDNGRTWSDWELVCQDHPRQGELVCDESEQDNCHDPVPGKVIQTRFQRIVRGDPTQTGLFHNGQKLFWDHVFYLRLADLRIRPGAASRLHSGSGRDRCQRVDQRQHPLHSAGLKRRTGSAGVPQQEVDDRVPGWRAELEPGYRPAL